jgi:N-acetylglutamate synthase-like GNAT family acetyltransferase
MGRNYKKDGKSDSTKKWLVRNYFKPGDVGSLTFLHGTIYAKEYGYDHTFEAYVGKELADFVCSFDPDTERFWLVEMKHQIVGCIAIVKKGRREAQLRWFFVHPDFRRRGIGQYLLAEAVEFCKQQKYETISLWTTSELRTAHRLYTRVGFKKTEGKTHTIWGKRITEERYELCIGDTSQ